MTDRRHAARLLVLVVAGLAVAGTAAATPVPAPTQNVSLAGSVHLTAAAPVALQPIHVESDVGDVDQVTIDAGLTNLPADGFVLATIESADGTVIRAERPAAQLAVGTTIRAEAAFQFSCSARPCAGAYLLVVTWIGAPSGGAADVPWTVIATARFRRPSAGGSAAPGRITARADATDAGSPESAKLSTATNGAAVHLTESDRFRAWTVAFHRDEAAGATGDQRSVVQARLRPAVTQTAGTGFAAANVKDRREELRRDPPVQLRVIEDGGQLAIHWASDGAVDFDPFGTCDGTAACDRTMTIGLAWADGRPETEFDAGWTIDLATIGLKGSVEPMTPEVAVVPAVALTTATATGSFEATVAPNSGRTRFVLSGAPIVDEASPWWTLGLPVRGSVTLRVMSVGSATLPPDAEFEVTVGEAYTSRFRVPTRVAIRPGETSTVAFEPDLTCTTTYPKTCTVDGTMVSEVFGQVPAPDPGALRLRVDWTMQVGLAVAADPGVTVAVDPLPSASPSNRP
jgi:hypothetical protein